MSRIRRPDGGLAANTRPASPVSAFGDVTPCA